MKKLLAMLLALTMLLSLGVTAFAAGSPVKVITTDDLENQEEPQKDRINAVKGTNKSKSGKDIPDTAIKIIPVDKMDEDQKKTVNEDLKKIMKDGYLPVEAYYIEADEQYAEDIETVVIVVRLNEGEVIFYNGTLYTREDMRSLGDGEHYEITVTLPCTIIFARKK